MSEYLTSHTFFSRYTGPSITEKTNVISHSENNLIFKSSVKTRTLTLPPVLPSSFTITAIVPPFDQGALGSCVCNSAAYVIRAQTNVIVSRLLLYDMARIKDLTSLSMDEGTLGETVASILRDYGYCLETVYPYNTSESSKLPPLGVFKSIVPFKKFTYYKIVLNEDPQNNPNILKNVLSTTNNPLSFAIAVFDTFVPDNNGIIPMAKLHGIDQPLGGHQVTIVGYDDNLTAPGSTPGCFYCANSWGTDWGKNGFFYLPYDYFREPEIFWEAISYSIKV